MSWTLVIGPSKWKAGHQPALPEGLVDLVPKQWKRRGRDVLWPIDIRAILAGLLRREGVEATLMEDDLERERESHSAHFSRLVRNHRRGHFFGYWPLNANISGLIWELSHLGTRIEDRRLQGHQLHLFPEEGVVRFDGETVQIVFTEEGNRTTYFEDIGIWGCVLHPWTDYASLMEKLLEAGAAEPSAER